MCKGLRRERAGLRCSSRCLAGASAAFQVVRQEAGEAELGQILLLSPSNSSIETHPSSQSLQHCPPSPFSLNASASACATLSA